MPKRTIIKKVVGWVLIVIGLVALLTPLTPGSWLIFVGLEFLGVRLLFWNRIKSRLKKFYRQPDKEIKN